MGLGLALLVGLGLQFGSGVFTKDINVKYIITLGVPVFILSFNLAATVDLIYFLSLL